MKKIAFCLVVLMSFAASAFAAPLSCFKEGADMKVEFYGDLKQVTRKHPNGENFDSYVLDLQPASTSFCFVSQDLPDTIVVDQTNSIQVNPMDMDDNQKTLLARSVGKKVTIRAIGFYTAHTAWHVRPVVATAISVSK